MKKIRHPRDLAINGAAPAFEQPVHVGRPNIGDECGFVRRIREMLDRRWLSNDGPFVRELEQRIAARLEVRHCVAMCNATVALQIAARALGLSGEVITPSYTFVATAHALYWQGITPVFADIDPGTHNLDPAAVRRMITPKTTGILAVHLWGRGAPDDALRQIAEEHGLKLFYDAAHAFDCSLRGRRIGQFGSCEIFSFHATKFFNTLEGGAVLTNDDDLAETMRLMRNFGFAGYDDVVRLGTNAKMVEASAAMGLANLECVDSFIECNRRNYEKYREAFAQIDGVALLPFDESERNNFQYIVVEVAEQCGASRDDIVAALHAENILARRYFWPGCHRMRPYRDLFPRAGLLLPNTARVAERVIVLPNGTTLPDGVVDVIADVVIQVARGGHIRVETPLTNGRREGTDG